MSETDAPMSTDERLYLFETVMIAMLEEATHDSQRFHRLYKILQAKIESVEGKFGDCSVSRKMKELQRNANNLHLHQFSQTMKKGLAESGLAPDLARKPN